MVLSYEVNEKWGDNFTRADWLKKSDFETIIVKKLRPLILSGQFYNRQSHNNLYHFYFR